MDRSFSPAARAEANRQIAALGAERAPLDPVILFSGICLIAMVVAFAFGEPGLWI